jgi:hypothetical protein
VEVRPRKAVAMSIAGDDCRFPAKGIVYFLPVNGLGAGQ